jgi:uncharacterized protein YigE (DUF2233 family)
MRGREVLGPMTITRNKNKHGRTSGALALLVCGLCLFSACPGIGDEFITYTIDPKAREVRMYWKDEGGAPFATFQNLKTRLAEQGRELVFAMNGGIFDATADKKPLGLFIENYSIRVPLNRADGDGNFYLKPNGVFYLTRGREAVLCTTDAFPGPTDVAYATQSGPLLVIDGVRNPQFTAGSNNRFVRNGVGILGDGRILFVMSKREVNFYDFSGFILEQGCRNALYLDGFISQIYLPENNFTQQKYDFGVIIAVAEGRTTDEEGKTTDFADRTDGEKRKRQEEINCGHGSRTVLTSEALETTDK